MLRFLPPPSFLPLYFCLHGVPQSFASCSSSRSPIAIPDPLFRCVFCARAEWERKRVTAAMHHIQRLLPDDIKRELHFRLEFKVAKSATGTRLGICYISFDPDIYLALDVHLENAFSCCYVFCMQKLAEHNLAYWAGLTRLQSGAISASRF